MDLKVADILLLPEYSDIQLIAGHGGLDRIVRGVNIVEVPTVSLWMRGGEILFSSGYAFGGDEERGVRLLHDLYNHNVAALFLKLGSYLGSIEEMKRCADHLKFPLLTIPKDRPYSQYINPVYELLINQKAKTLEVSNSICSHLFNIDADQSYHALCVFVSESLRQPVFLVDDSGRVIEGSVELDERYNEAFRLLSAQYGYKYGFINQFSFTSENEEISLLFISIESSQKRVAYLVAIETNESDHELSCAVLPFVARVIQMKELHNYSLLQQRNKIAGDLLGDIIEQRYEYPSTIVQRGRLLHIDLTQNLLVIVIQIVRDYNYNDLNSSTNDKERIYQTIKEKILGIEPRVLFLEYDQLFVALLQVNYANSSADYGKIIGSVMSGDDTLNQVKIASGISRIAQGIKEVPRLFDQAKVASKLAVNSKLSNPVFCYDDLGISRIFPELAESFELAQIMDETLKPIIQYDREHKTDYLSILQAFYANNGVISKTAKELYIHKNTMINYLKTLEEITGHDLRDYRSVMQFMFSLEYYDLFENEFHN